MHEKFHDDTFEVVLFETCQLTVVDILQVVEFAGLRGVCDALPLTLKELANLKDSHVNLLLNGRFNERHNVSRLFSEVNLCHVKFL